MAGFLIKFQAQYYKLLSMLMKKESTMKLFALITAMFALLMAPLCSASAATKLSTNQDKLSYTIGYDMGQNFKSQGVKVEPKMVTQGLQDGLAGSKPAMSEQEMEQTMISFQKKVMAKRAKQYKQMSSDNAKKGQDFLTSNKSKPGVKTMPSGLQYKVIKAGKGPTPAKNSVVTVDYSGKLVDGQVFDSSYKRGHPSTFPLSEVIPGWQEALTHMKQGATWEVYVPAKLAYGNRMMGPIPPNSTLIFKIHLIKVKAAADGSDKGKKASN